jgi:rhamnosyltransferase
MTRPKVLVLLAAFNGSKWILEQVESILRQVNVDVHLVISDDGSTDGTRSMIDRLTIDRRIRVVSPDVATGSAAQNFLWLIRQSPGDEYDFISFADQDDIWDEDKVFRGCSALMGSGAQGYSSAVIAVWSDGRENALTQVAIPTASDFLFEGAGQGCTYVLEHKFYRKLRTFFIRYASETEGLHYHDWAIYALARSWKLKWVFDRTPSLRYRQHEENDTGARSSVGGIQRRLSRIKNGWYSRQMRTIANICLTASPGHSIVSRWHNLLVQPRGVLRQWHMACFCLRGGRRRWSDRAILLSAVVVGWI